MGKTLSQYLAGYSVKFTKPLDQIWDEHDIDGNGQLDKNEAKTFLDEIVTYIDSESA